MARDEAAAHLPRVVYIFQILTTQFDPIPGEPILYGRNVPDMVPTLLHPERGDRRRRDLSVPGAQCPDIPDSKPSDHQGAVRTTREGSLFCRRDRVDGAEQHG